MAIGTIIGVIATHIFDATLGHYPAIQQIDEDLHCIAYRGADNDGWSKSVNITAAGAIAEPASNTLEFDAVEAAYSKACVRPTHILCNFYLSANAHRYVEAIKVNADGTLEQHANHRVQFTTANYTFGPPLHRHGDIVAIAYQHQDGTAHVCTVTVSDEGEVTDPVTSDLATTAIVQGYPSLAHVAGNVHVLMYQDGGNNGYAISVNISEGGVVSATGQPNTLIAAQYNWSNNLIKIKDNTFVCVHDGPTNTGVAAVFQCSDTGVITVPTNNIYEFEASLCDTPWALRITDEVFAVAYSGVGTDGFLKTIKCEVASAATWTAVSTLEFDTTHCDDVVIIKRGPGVYTLCYQGPGDDGVLKTVEITDSPIVYGHTELIMGMGP